MTFAKWFAIYWFLGSLFSGFMAGLTAVCTQEPKIPTIDMVATIIAWPAIVVGALVPGVKSIPHTKCVLDKP